MDSPACNIGQRGRRQRMFGAVAMLVLFVGLVAALFVFDLPRVARLAVAVPLFVAGLSLFQARAGT